jgi:hypothetical protein
MMTAPAVGFFDLTLASLLGSGVAATIVGFLLVGRTERITGKIKALFEEQQHKFVSQRAYQEAALAELFGPVKMQLGRTQRAFGRWKEHNEFIEAEVMQDGNRTIRDLLLQKGHLIPPSLIESAQQLIEHVDAWLEEYDRVRVKKTASNRKFVFVGPQGYPFPREAERKMVAHADWLQAQLYGEVTTSS